MPYLAKIILYPWKSLDGCEVEQASLLASGALEGDRMFALFDREGRYINGKRNARVHQLRSCYDFKERCLTLRIEGETTGHSFQLDHEKDRLLAWLSDYFAQPVSIQEESTHGFPDDRIAPGPTIIGASTLSSIADWFPLADPATFPRRFRANLEIADAEPFWEDRLYGKAETVVCFRIGEVLFEGTNPCKRCVVPSRDPLLGTIYPRFQKDLAEKREENLPVWAERSRFNHYYRLAVNTRVPSSEAGKTIHLGDEVVTL